MATGGFVWGAGGAKLTPEQIALQRAILAKKLAQGTDTSPVAHWAQGAARVADAFADVMAEKRLDKADAAAKAEDSTLSAPLIQALTGQSASIPMPGAAGEVAATAPKYDAAPVTAKGEVADYIRQSAAARGIDPDIALRVAMSEGGVDDPVRQSLVVKNGVREQSYGPFQLYMGGGLGNKALAAGIDPRDPSQWKQGVDFALDQAKTGGWGPWYGAKKLGITGMAGIGSAPVQTAPVVPVEVASIDAPQTATDAIAAQSPLPQAVDPSTAAYAPQQPAPELPPPTEIAAPPAVAAQPPVQVAQAPQAQLPQVPQVAPQALAAAIQAVNSPYASPQTKSLANALIQRQQAAQQAQQEQAMWLARQQYEAQQQAADPLRQLQIQETQLKLDQARDPNANVPDSVRALEIRAKNAGLQPGTPEFQKFMLSGGDKGITINNEGSIPAGYQAVRDPEGRITSIQPIPGSPAALEMEQALKAKDTQSGRKETATDVITNAATEARNLLKNGTLTTGTLGRLAANLTESDAAELRRQIGVLTSNATIENLTAMRQASPTGGALGSVTEKEGAMLAAAAGAIDPNAGKDQVEKSLDNYEKTLLRVIHGPKVGDAIFDQTRQKKPTVIDGYQIEEVE